MVNYPPKWIKRIICNVKINIFAHLFCLWFDSCNPVKDITGHEEHFLSGCNCPSLTTNSFDELWFTFIWLLSCFECWYFESALKSFPCIMTDLFLCGQINLSFFGSLPCFALADLTECLTSRSAWLDTALGLVLPKRLFSFVMYVLWVSISMF